MKDAPKTQTWKKKEDKIKHIPMLLLKQRRTHDFFWENVIET